MPRESLLSKLKKVKNKKKFLKSHCCDAASAIKNKHGGEIYILGDYPSQEFFHTVVKKNGRFWDVSGSRSKKQLMNKYPKMPLRKATRKDLGYMKRYRNKKAYDHIKKILN